MKTSGEPPTDLNDERQRWAFGSGLILMVPIDPSVHLSGAAPPFLDRPTPHSDPAPVPRPVGSAFS